MASKLLSQYGFSRDKLKVLLGGWNKWKELNGKDANGYPTDISTSPTSPVQQPGISITVVPGASTPGASAPSGIVTPNLVTVPTTAP